MKEMTSLVDSGTGATLGVGAGLPAKLVFVALLMPSSAAAPRSIEYNRSADDLVERTRGFYTAVPCSHNSILGIPKINQKVCICSRNVTHFLQIFKKKCSRKFPNLP